MSAYVRRELRVSNRADCSQKYQIMPKKRRTYPFQYLVKRRAATCYVCNNICFFYAFLNIMGYVSGRISDQRSYKRKNSGPSKKLDFTLFFTSVKGFEPPAFRLGGERSILLSYTDLFTFFGFFIHLINRQKSRGDCSTSALGGERSILLSYRNMCRLSENDYSLL